MTSKLSIFSNHIEHPKKLVQLYIIPFYKDILNKKVHATGILLATTLILELLDAKDDKLVYLLLFIIFSFLS